MSALLSEKDKKGKNLKKNKNRNKNELGWVDILDI
jgi:hypothetical protein